MGSTVTSVRVVGALLVERGLITPAQLAEALEHQRAHGGELDEIVPRLFGLPRSEVAAVASDLDGARSIDLGTILYATGVVDDARLGEARERSSATGQPLGPILVEMGAISRLDLASALADQWADSPAEILPSPAAREAFRQQAAAAEADDLRTMMAALEESMRVARESGDESGLLDEVLRREAALAARVASLEHAIDQPIEADPALVAEIHGIGEALAGLRSSLADVATTADVAALRDSVGSLEELRERLAAQVEDAAPAEAVERTRAELASLRALLEAIQERTDAAAPARLLETVVDEVTELAARVEQQNDATGAVSALRDAVAELAARVEGAAAAVAQVDALSATVDGLRARASEVESLSEAVESLRADVAGLAERPSHEGALAERVELLATELAEAVAGLEERLGTALATTVEIPGLASEVGRVAERLSTLEAVDGELESLRAAVSAVRDQPLGDEGLSDRVESLAQRVETLSVDALRPAAEAAVADLAGRVDALAAAHGETRERAAELGERLTSLRAELAAHGAGSADTTRLDELAEALADLTHRVDGAAPASGLAALLLAVEELQSLQAPHDRRIGSLEQRVAEVEEQADAAHAASHEALGALRERLDGLATEAAARFDAVLARIDLLETVGAPAGAAGSAGQDEPGLRDEVVTLAATVDSVRASFAASLERLERAWEEERSSLRQLVAARSADAAPHAAPADPSGAAPLPPAELLALERALERVSDRVVEQERSLVEHFARRERALIERLGAGTDVGQRLSELTRGLEELRGRVERASGGVAGGGGASPEELSALKESVFGRLEKLASSIDWRFQRLEGGPGTAAGAADLQARLTELTQAVEQLSHPAPVNGNGSAPPPVPPAPDDRVFLALVPMAGGHQLVELHGPTPRTGSRISLSGEDGELLVVAVGTSPLPGDDRACVFVEAVDAPAPA